MIAYSRGLLIDYQCIIISSSIIHHLIIDYYVPGRQQYRVPGHRHVCFLQCVIRIRTYVPLRARIRIIFSYVQYCLCYHITAPVTRYLVYDAPAGINHTYR